MHSRAVETLFSAVEVDTSDYGSVYPNMLEQYEIHGWLVTIICQPLEELEEVLLRYIDNILH